MRRGTFALVAILVGVLLAGVPASAASENYVIATDSAPYEPYEYDDVNGNFVGIDIDLINAIAEDQGFTITFRRLQFDDALQLVRDDQADGAIAAIWITDERTREFDFSEPYFEDQPQMGVLATNDDITSYDDLRGRRVAVQTESDAALFAASIKDSYGFTIAHFDNTDAAFDDVRNGNSQAVFTDSAYLNFEILLGNGFKTVTPAERGTSLGFVVKKGRNAQLLQMFNTGLTNLKESGRYDQIVGRYVGQPATAAEAPFWVQLIARIVEALWVPALAVVLALIIYAVRNVVAWVRRPKDPHDDPEARIRELERSLDDRGQTRS